VEADYFAKAREFCGGRVYSTTIAISIAIAIAIAIDIATSISVASAIAIVFCQIRMY